MLGAWVGRGAVVGGRGTWLVLVEAIERAIERLQVHNQKDIRENVGKAFGKSAPN